MKPANDNTNFLQADVANLLAEVDALLSAFPELADDEQLRADMLEGETNAFAVLTRLLNIERDADSMAKAVASRISDLNARKDRSIKRKDAMRTLMLRFMRATGLTKAPLVDATVSVGKGRDSVEIADETKLPRSYMRVVTSPDKTAIKLALDAGKKVRGACMRTGDDVLTVRAA